MAGNHRIDLDFPGGAPESPVGRLEHSARSHHLTGADPSRWVTDVRAFGQVLYRRLYPGIDLVYRPSADGRVEFDLVVGPGGRPADVRLRLGGGNARVDRSGDLVVGAAGAVVRVGKPRVFQEVDGAERPVAGRFVLLGEGLFGLRVGPYDDSRPLVIDPVLTYSTYFGGSSADYGNAVAIGPSGNVYVAGTTYSGDLPAVSAFQPVNNSPAQRDAFVSAFDPTGQRLLFSTFLGGKGSYDIAHAVAVDASGGVYVTGETHSLDFPVTPGAFQRDASIWAGSDGFVAKLSPDGRTLVFSTFLAATGSAPSFESCYAIAVGRDGSVTVGGDTSTPTWPVTEGAFRTTGCGTGVDGFVTRLSPDGRVLVWSTYLCGAGGLDSVRGLWVGEDGSAVATGRTGSSDFPRAGQVISSRAGASDAFVTKIDPSGGSLAFSRFLGGTDGDHGFGVAVDPSGGIWIGGMTRSTDFPVRGAFQPAYGGGSSSCGRDYCGDAFLAKLDGAGELAFSTYFGGRGDEGAWSLALSRGGTVAIGGPTSSSNLPTREPVQATNRGGAADAFVAAFDLSGAPLFSTYLGGSDSDELFGLAFDPVGRIVAFGKTASADFPTFEPFQPKKFPGDNTDTFVARFELAPVAAEVFVPVVLSAAGKAGSYFSSELAIANRGVAAIPLTLTYTPAPGLGGGAGTVTESLPGGQQRVVPDAIAWLGSLGLGVGSDGSRGGTLRVGATGLADPSALAVTARTTTPAANGRAGLAYAGVPGTAGLDGPSIVAGLRQTSADRSNLALQNLGRAGEGDVTLRLTVVSGDPSAPLSHVLPLQTIPPGGFVQVTEVLHADGLSVSNGFVKVERTGGTAPYYAYGVINDQANSDGSFVPPVTELGLVGNAGLTVPVVVETAAFASELVLTNTSASPRSLRAAWVADGLTTADRSATLELVLQPFEQRVVPDFVQALRSAGTAGVPPRGPNLAGALFVTPSTDDLTGVTIGARTSSAGGGGRFGLFYTAVPFGRAAQGPVWLYGLRQDGENRTNLALVNTGEADGGSDTFRVDVYDGSNGRLAVSLEEVVVAARSFRQINSVLASYAPGVTQAYARVVRTAGSNPFVAYAVVNDGAGPGERTGDGAFVASLPE